MLMEHIQSETTQNKTKKKFKRLKVKPLLVIFCCAVTQTVTAQVEVCPENTPWFYSTYDGGASGSPGYCDGVSACPNAIQDPDLDSAANSQRFYIDDEQSKITSIRYCTADDNRGDVGWDDLGQVWQDYVCNNANAAIAATCGQDPNPYIWGNSTPKQHFRGFEVTFTTSTGPQVLTFGNMVDYCDDEATETITEEIMRFLILVDSNDIEGFALKDYQQYIQREAYCTSNYATPSQQIWDPLCFHVFRANGFPDSPEYSMGGRPIGFDIRMSDEFLEGGFGLFRDWDDYDHSTGQTVPWIPQPVAMRIIYNTCNCPATNFIGDGPPSDMTIQIQNIPTVDQVLPYQNNYIEFVYDQDCGTYELEFTNADTSAGAVDIMQFLTVEAASGSGGPNNKPYSQLMTLATGDDQYIGQYNAVMSVKQHVSNGHFHINKSGGQLEMATIEYPFVLTVNPCVATLAITDDGEDWTYNLGDSDLVQTFAFTQTPACYIETLTLSPSLSWLTIDQAAGTITLPQTYDSGIAGVHSVTLTSSFDQWDDFSKVTTTATSQSITFSVTVIDPTPVNVCPKETSWFYVTDTSGGSNYSVINGDGHATPDLDTAQDSHKKIIDDAQAKIKSLKSCVASTGTQFYTGFEVIWSTSGGDETRTFGDCTLQADTFDTHSITEELMYYSFAIDVDDIEGNMFTDYAQNQDVACVGLTVDQLVSDTSCSWALTANPASLDWVTTLAQLEGRPVGFNIRLEQPTAAFDHIVAIQIIQNECNCPAATYFGDSAPNDMTINAISDPSRVEALSYQKNNMEEVYNQDCGGYTIAFQPVDPTCDMSGVLTPAAPSGAGGALNSHSYSQQLTLESFSQADIGSCAMELVVTSDGAGKDAQNNDVVIPEQKYQFQATVNPCQAILTDDIGLQPMYYELTTNEISQPYSITQSPACGYTETVTLQDSSGNDCGVGSPTCDFIIFDEATGTVKIDDYFDTTKLGSYNLVLSKKIDVPTDWQQTVVNEVKVDVPFNVQILTNTNPESVCPDVQAWLAATHADTGYTAVNGFATPSDDRTQEFRQVVIDDELARISEIIVYINKDEDEPVAVNHVIADLYGVTYQYYKDNIYPLNGCDESVLDGCGCLTRDPANPCPEDQHFRGWKVTWETSTGSEQHCFGDCSDFYTSTNTLTFTDEIMYFSMSIDDNDIEGFAFKEYTQAQIAACNLLSHTDQLLDSTCWQLIIAGPQADLTWNAAQKMNGRPIGFDLRMGNSNGSFGWGLQTYGEWMQHVSAMRIITNECNCPASSFIVADINPTDMEISIGAGSAATQVIGYVNNWIEFVYEQDCGTYTVNFEPVDPACDMSAALSSDARSGSAPPNSKPYSQLITFDSNDSNLVGQCAMNIVIEQDASDPSDSFLDGYSNERRMNPLKVPFTATVNPCTVTLATNDAPEQMSYTLGDNAISQLYDIEQAPSCYTEVVTLKMQGHIDPLILTDVSWITADPTAGTGTINIPKTFDRDIIGIHTFELTKTVSEPADYTKTTYNEIIITETFIVEIIDPCLTTVLDPLSAESMSIVVEKDAETQELEMQDSVSRAFGFQTCGDFLYEFVTVVPTYLGANDYWNFLDFQTTDGARRQLASQDEKDVIVAQSRDMNHVGDYDVTVRAGLDLDSDGTWEFSTATTFPLTIRACQIDDVIIQEVNPRIYHVSKPELEINWDNFVQDPNCEHPWVYRFYLEDIDTGEIVDLEEDIPEWLRMWNEDLEELKFKIETSNNDYTGKYTIRVQAEFLDKYWSTIPLTPPTLEIDLEILGTDMTVGPQGSIALEDQEIDVYEDLFYPVRSKLPDCPPDTWPTVDVTTGTSREFLTWNQQARLFMIERGVADKEAVGNHTITVSQTCQNATYVQTFTHSFNLRVNGIEDVYVPPPPDNRITQDYRIYNSSANGMISGIYDGCQPVPHIVQMTPCGILQIGWDRPMNAPANFSDIQPTRVGLRLPDYRETTYNHYWRRNLLRRWEWIRNEREYPEYMISAEALELKIRPGDGSDIRDLNFTWTLIDYTENNIWLQLEWEKQKKVYENRDDLDYLQVVFWGNDFGFFGSKAQPGCEVKQGTMLEWPIVQQCNVSGCAGGWAFLILRVLLMLMMLAVILFTGRLLPVWMFINSLTLICHTQYFKTNMPGFLALFLTELLKVPRFDLVPQWREKFEDIWGFSREGAHNELFQLHDYNSYYLMGTMGHLIMIYAIIIGILWLLLGLKDLFVRFRAHWDVDQQHKRIRGIFWLFKHEPYWHNFTNRYIYEIFFEACLCTMITVANEAYETSYQRKWRVIGCIGLLCCGLFACYVIGHYWTSLFKYFRKDSVLIFIKNVVVGIYKRHFTWVPPIARKIGALLYMCFGPCIRCFGRCFSRIGRRFKGILARCTGGRCSKFCDRGRQNKKKEQLLRHSNTLRKGQNKEQIDIITTTVKTMNGIELSRTVLHDEPKSFTPGRVKRSDSGVFEGTTNDVTQNMFFLRDQNILGLNKPKDANSQSTAETMGRLAKTPETYDPYAALYGLNSRPQSKRPDIEEKKNKGDGTDRTLDNDTSVVLAGPTHRELIKSAEEWYGNDKNDEENKIDTLSHGQPNTNSNPMYSVWDSAQLKKPSSPVSVVIDNQSGQISIKTKPVRRNSGHQKIKTKTILTPRDEEMIDGIISRHSQHNDEQDLLEGGEKEGDKRTPQGKKTKDQVHENESDSYYSEEVVSSYGTDEDENGQEPFCNTIGECLRGCASGCASRCKRINCSCDVKRCDPRNFNCKTIWKSCWEGSKKLTRQATQHPTGILGFKKPIEATIDDESSYYAKHYITMDDELFKDVRKDVNCMEQGREKNWWRSRTFFYGLKLYHENDVQMLHLAAYIVRRIVFAFCLVFVQDCPALGIWLLMMSSVFMIAILCRDNQWWEQKIRKQHLVNEVTLYFMCILLLMLADIWDNFDCFGYTVIGGFFAGLLLLNVLYNSYVIIRYTKNWLDLYSIRRVNIIENRDYHKSLKKLNERTLKKHEKLQHLCSKENQKSWDAQWKKLCDNRDGWLRQEASGHDYVLIYDYTIQKKVETVDVKREEIKPEIMPIIKEKTESEPTPPPSPKKSDSFKASDEDENFIAANLYDDDSKGGMANMTSKLQKDLNESVGRMNQSQSHRDSLSCSTGKKSSQYKPVQIVNGMPVFEPDYDPFFVKRKNTNSSHEFDNGSNGTSYKKLFGANNQPPVTTVIETNTFMDAVQPKKMSRRPSIVLVSPHGKEDVLHDDPIPLDKYNPLIGPANIKYISEQIPQQTTTKTTTITSGPPREISKYASMPSKFVTKGKAQPNSRTTTTTEIITLGQPSQMSKFNPGDVNKTIFAATSAGFMPKNEIGNAFGGQNQLITTDAPARRSFKLITTENIESVNNDPQDQEEAKHKLGATLGNKIMRRRDSSHPDQIPAFIKIGGDGSVQMSPRGNSQNKKFDSNSLSINIPSDKGKEQKQASMSPRASQMMDELLNKRRMSNVNLNMIDGAAHETKSISQQSMNQNQNAAAESSKHTIGANFGLQTNPEVEKMSQSFHVLKKGADSKTNSMLSEIEQLAQKPSSTLLRTSMTKTTKNDAGSILNEPQHRQTQKIVTTTETIDVSPRQNNDITAARRKSTTNTTGNAMVDQLLGNVLKGKGGKVTITKK